MSPKPTHYSKKPRLTLAQLTSYDDILTDALVDHAYYWTTIRKNKSAYHLSRGIKEEDVASILRQHVIVNNDTLTAEQELLALPALKKFSATLKTEHERDNFRKHLRKYISIYKVDCPFEVASTNRYTVVTHEAAVTAREFIKKGQTVKYLTGIQIVLTDEEMEGIKSALRDFSIVVSSRKKSTSLFLGPARFANHDCNANARLSTSGRDGMDIVAARDIQIGDEITVSYGEDYFDEDNSSCLCHTCEERCVNGWTMPASSEDKVIPKLSIEESSQHEYKFRQRRRREDSFSERDGSMTPEVNLRPRANKRTPKTLSRFQSQNSPSESSPSPETVASPLKRKLEEQISPSSSKKRRKPSVKAEPSHLSFSMVANDIPDSPETASRRDSSSPSNDTQTATDATSVDDEDTIVVQEVKPSSSLLTKLRKSQKTRLTPSKLKSEGPIALGESTSIQHPVLQDDNSSVLSDLSSAQFDEMNSTMTFAAEKQKKKKRVATPKTDLDHAPSTRYPGDYQMTERLLSEPQMSYITCLVCEETFIQKDSYFTRSSCPRCERHSKLYGFRWPKTDFEGSDDEDERVLDHRIIHRFITPAEEKASRKRARSFMVGGGGDTPAIREESEKVEEPKVRTKRKYKQRAANLDLVEANEEPAKRRYRKRARVTM